MTDGHTSLFDVFLGQSGRNAHFQCWLHVPATVSRSDAIRQRHTLQAGDQDTVGERLAIAFVVSVCRAWLVSGCAWRWRSERQTHLLNAFLEQSFLVLRAQPARSHHLGLEDK